MNSFSRGYLTSRLQRVRRQLSFDKLVNPLGNVPFRNHELRFSASSVVRNTKRKIPHKLLTLAETPLLDPLKHKDYFGTDKLVNIADLFDARVHLGHKRGVADPHFSPFVYGNRFDIQMIDLNLTLPRLRRALEVVAHISYKQGLILLVCQNRQHQHSVEKAALSCGVYCHTRTWKAGLFTNFFGEFGVDAELPDLMVFLHMQGENSIDHHLGITEAAKMCVPTIGICDSNFDPRLLTYCIPGNDDSPSSIDLYLNLIVQAVSLGKSKYEKRHAILESRRSLLKDHNHDIMKNDADETESM